MLLNCDLGESYADRTVGNDAAIMPFIHQANIACGFHGGDPLTIDKTLNLAAEHGVAVGAHPSYPDREGFGRRSMQLSRAALIANLHYQVAALEGMARLHGLVVSHIKPHGALYNDMMANDAIREAVFAAVASWQRPLQLVVQATPAAQQHREEARAADISLVFEAFADRCYTDEGALQSRAEPGAVHSTEKMLAQVEQLVSDGTVTTAGGKVIAIEAETLCVHGDNPAAISAVQAIRKLVDGS